MVRTIAPEDAAHRVPARYLPSMASADRERLPALESIAVWLEGAWFRIEERKRVLRNTRLHAAEEPHLRIEVASR